MMKFAAFYNNQFYKFIVINYYTLNVEIKFENYDTNNLKCFIFNKPIIPLKLIHVPIKSVDQINRKFKIGSYRFFLNSDKNDGDRFHWEKIAKFIRNNNKLFKRKNLISFVQNNAVHDEINLNKLELNFMSIDCMEDNFKFRELAKKNFLESFEKINKLVI